MTPQVEAQVVELGRELKRLVHAAGIRLEDMSLSLGFHRHYLGRSLRGRLPLKVEVAFRVLNALRQDPHRFFEDLYPFGGPAMAAVLRRPSPGGGRDESLRRLGRELRKERGEEGWSPALLAKRSGEVLRGMLRRRGIRQRDASLALGMGPTALGQVLRGYAELHFGHVFGTLGVCGAPPGRFVQELFGPRDQTLLGKMRWLRALDYAERVVTGMMETYARRRGLLPAEPGEVQPAGAGAQAEPRPAAERAGGARGKGKAPARGRSRKRR